MQRRPPRIRRAVDDARRGGPTEERQEGIRGRDDAETFVSKVARRSASDIDDGGALPGATPAFLSLLDRITDTAVLVYDAMQMVVA